ncbi:uncharacterized protein LOC126739533 [Anthonomus grandis grandis]|uniref:uncharacterized protein LOC126739533 n=1 Tax=Anthonomus grandis grandis TaxID=2921223 RepID=UPI002165472D|nr:uncharacterized protein LOC126739533 [Anthonomus grandis grandis]
MLFVGLSLSMFLLFLLNMGYTEEEKFEIMRLFYKNNNNVARAQAEYHRIHPEMRVPARSTFYYTERSMRNHKNLQRKKRTVLANADEELQILLYFQEKPYLSTVDASRHFQCSRSKIQRVLQKYGYHPYKLMPVQKLTNNHEIRRLTYCNQMLDIKNVDNDIFNKILWTDEAVFTTAGMYNRKNTHMWAPANPHAYVEIKKKGRMHGRS